MNFSGFIGNLKTHEMKMKMREETETPKKAIAFKATPSTIDEEDSSKDRDEDFACSLGEWAKYFIRREDKITSEEDDLKEDLKRERRRWVLSFIARRRAI